MDFCGAVLLARGPGTADLIAIFNIFKPALPLVLLLVFTLLAATLAPQHGHVGSG
jgi:hypothetical protein